MKQQCLLLLMILSSLFFLSNIQAALSVNDMHARWVEEVEHRIDRSRSSHSNEEAAVLHEVKQRLEQEGNRIMYCSCKLARQSGNVQVAPPRHRSLLKTATRECRRRLFKMLIKYGADLTVPATCGQSDHVTIFEQLFEEVTADPIMESSLERRRHGDECYKLLYFLRNLQKNKQDFELLTTVVSRDPAYIILDMDNSSLRGASSMLPLLRTTNHAGETFLDRAIGAPFRSHGLCVRLMKLGVRLGDKSSLQRSLGDSCPLLWKPILICTLFCAAAGLPLFMLFICEPLRALRMVLLPACIGGGLGALVGLGMFCHDEGLTLRERYTGWKHGITDSRGNRIDQIAEPD